MSSPFASYLGTNYSPRDTELAQIRRLLIEPGVRLKRLEDEIAAIQKTLDELTEERDTLSAYVEAHKALMSPIRRLPVEIIQDIFLACLPTHRNCVMSAQEAPIILGRICSSWRAISLSLPQLWSRLHIAEPVLPPPNSPNRRLTEAKVAQRLEVAYAWLRRSGDCPLSISLESRSNRPMNAHLADPVPSSPNLFMEALVSFAHRWQNIRLAAQLETLLHLTENDVPILKQLELVQYFENPPNFVSQFGILHSPSLTSFSFAGSNNLSDLPLRWNQLTSLSLFPRWDAEYAQTCQVALDILSICPKLQTCRLIVHDSPDVTNAVIECPLLQTIDLVCVNGSLLHTAGRLLSHLSLPGLEDFKLGGQQDPQQESTAGSLLSSLAASPRLKIIKIDSDAFTKSSLIDFLRGLPPTIQQLHILDPIAPWIEAWLDDDGLAVLATHCPGLQELTILNCRKVSDEALLRFISGMPALKHIAVEFRRERDSDIRPSIQPLVDGGLSSIITYLPDLPPPPFSPWEGLFDEPS
ncbi:hypothetical protein DFH08DRAFT_728613 [Mycena albidolilacea]|uniref:F-box domain-containing protein n=1 Tax=Mycena albidolilacea TaxID=1033008 RepID=A0AAD7AS47_9AGAR|nr:hypothetical protein DFH08DRAFT_728613 [Mycena albidolilacea]